MSSMNEHVLTPHCPSCSQVLRAEIIEYNLIHKTVKNTLGINVCAFEKLIIIFAGLQNI